MYRKEVTKFINDVSEWIIKNNLIFFIGAGINVEVGLPTLKSLLGPLAEELGISIDNPPNGYSFSDLAQDYEDESTRNNLISKLKKYLDTKNIKPGKNLLSIAKLPVKEFWTTNYDNLLEKSFDILGKDYMNIINKFNYAYLDTNKVDIFKMHGDLEHEETIILTNNDYEKYHKENAFFLNRFASDLSYKHCVFVGTSLNDENLEKILNNVSELIGQNNGPEHYFFYLKNDDDFYQNSHNGKLFKKFGIKSIPLDNWSEIKEIFDEINKNVIANNIFISGAAHEYFEDSSDPEVNQCAKDFISDLSYELITNDKKIFSGYGLGVGDSVVGGAMSAIEEKELDNNVNINKYFEVHPFPQNIRDEGKRLTIWRKNRDYMIENSGVVIFLFGNKWDSKTNKVVLSNGIINEEFEIAKAKNKKIIPIGSTGYAAKYIWEDIKNNIDKYPYLKDHIDRLERTWDPKEIINIVNDIILIK